VCNREAPGVERFARQHKDRLTIVGLGSQDDLAFAKRFVGKHSVTFRMLWDPTRKSWDALGVRWQPAALLLDRDGRVLHSYSGPFSERDVLERIA